MEKVVPIVKQISREKQGSTDKEHEAVFGKRSSLARTLLGAAQKTVGSPDKNNKAVAGTAAANYSNYKI